MFLCQEQTEGISTSQELAIVGINLMSWNMSMIVTAVPLSPPVLFLWLRSEHTLMLNILRHIIFEGSGPLDKHFVQSK